MRDRSAPCLPLRRLIAHWVRSYKKNGHRREHRMRHPL